MKVPGKMKVLLCAVMVCSGLTAVAEAPDKVYSSAEEAQPLQIGKEIPDVTVSTLESENIDLRALVAGKPSVLVFYRGGWCPYCNTHLKELKNAMKGLEDLGYQMLAISADTPEAINATKEKSELPYTLLSDADVEAATAFGIAFQLDPETIEKYKGYKIDLSHSEWRLPVPAVFLTNAEGVITFVHAEPDYKKRLSSAAVLDAAREALDTPEKA